MLLRTLALCALLILTTGCVTTTYSQPPRMIHTEIATVEDVRWVTVQRDTSAGRIIGGLAGAYLGTRIAGDRTSKRVIGGLAGAALGGAAGDAVTRGENSTLEIILVTRNGDEVLVRDAQGDFWIGQTVRIVYSDPIRIIPLD